MQTIRDSTLTLEAFDMQNPEIKERASKIKERRKNEEFGVRKKWEPDAQILSKNGLHLQMGA
ncbi:MAG: hypothetical protein IKV42_05800 [Burkholderiaceae bacterium]|nr:hypothetical protein [Burkholderiaceae bacterium]